MNINLIKYLECPLCHGELKWEIERKTAHQIIDGKAKCTKCDNIYPVEDSLAIFLKPKLQNKRIWDKCDRVSQKQLNNDNMKNNLCNYEKMNPKELLMEISIIDKSNASICAELYSLYMEKIGMDKTFELLINLSQRCAKEIGRDEIVLDFASGKCILAEEIMKVKKTNLIISDINPIILRNTQNELKKRSCTETISFMVFDIKNSPFKEKSIDITTTLLGLQNIIPYEGVLEEVNRISHRFFCISSFLREIKIANIQKLKYHKIEDMWIKELFKRKIDNLGWSERNVHSYLDVAKAVNEEEIHTRFAVMKFPVQDTIMEYNLTEYIMSSE